VPYDRSAETVTRCNCNYIEHKSNLQYITKDWIQFSINSRALLKKIIDKE